MTIDWKPRGFSYNLDDSFMVGLNKAFAENIQFGKDFVYTYGPYGFVQNGVYVPETYNALLLCRLFMGLVVGVGLLKIFLYCWKNHSRAASLFLLPFLCFFPESGVSTDSFYVIVVALPLVAYFYVDNQVNKGKLSPSLGLLIAGMAFASLIKQTTLTLAFAFVLLMSADQVLRRRRLPTILGLYLLSVLGFWLLAGQDISNIGAYLANGSQIVKGFPEAMSRPGPLLEIVIYAISVTGFVGLCAIATWRHRTIFDWLPILGLLLICFLTFKASFIRHDSHALQSPMTMIPIACLYTALLWPDIQQASSQLSISKMKTLPLVAAWALLLINAFVIFNNYPNIFNVGSPRRPYPYYYVSAIGKVGTTLQEAFSVMTGRANLQSIYDGSVEDIRDRNPMPPIESPSVDLYPNYTAVLFAYGLPYRPRPTTQSFTAYTGELAELNVAHLLEDDAPETILFDPSTDDDRLPGSDDGLSWPSLLTRYDLADVRGEYLVLSRSNQPREYSLAPIAEETIEMGEWTALPAEDDLTAIWMELDARPNWLGKLTNTLFKLPPFYIEVELADGSQERYRLLTNVAEAGQLLSPLLVERGNYAYMASPLWRDALRYAAVERFRLIPGTWSKFAYPKTSHLKLSTLDFERQSVEGVEGWSQLEALSLLKSGRVISDDYRKLATRVGPEGDPVFLAHADMRVEVDLPVALRSKDSQVALGFGLLEKTWKEAKPEDAADGVVFRFLAIAPDGSEAVLLDQWVNPLENMQDREEQTAEVTLPAGSVKVALETLEGPNQSDSWDQSYWSKFEIK